MRNPLIRGAASCLVVLIAATAFAGAPKNGTIYNATEKPLPPSMVSLGYEATSTTEFGDHIEFAGTARKVNEVVVTMVTWAYHAQYPTMSTSGWKHPITLNLYEVDPSGPDPDVGALIATVTQTFDIPWRPAPTPGYEPRWLARDGNAYNGFAFNITFKLKSLKIQLPDELIYGIVYNTADYGPAPILQPGPYNSLNVGLLEVAPSVGFDVEPDALFWDTSHAGFYTDGGAAGVGIFRRDTNWTPYTPAVKFVARQGSKDGKSKDDKSKGDDESND